MARDPVKHKGRRHTPSFVSLPHYVLNHPRFTELDGWTMKLLIDLCAQYKGSTNGDMSMAWSIMEKRGWRSRDTLRRARQELLSRGWIIQTRQGGRNKPSLYAVTLWAIDECGGKLDAGINPTTGPLHYWKTGSDPREKSLARQSCEHPPNKHAIRAKRTGTDG